jgi:hypothetical protein
LYGLICANGFKAPPYIETKRHIPSEKIFQNDLEGRVVKKTPKSEGKVGIKGMLGALNYFYSLHLFHDGDICTSH